MIYDRENIQISELCTLQFTEPLEYQMYDRQTDYCGKICGTVNIQILLSEGLYNLVFNNDQDLTLKCFDENDVELFSKAFDVYELSTGYYYAECFLLNELDSYTNKLCYFEIVSETISQKYADSLWYVIYPDYTGDIYEVKYQHTENDWNAIFVDDNNDSTYNFKIFVEGGFKPNDPRQEVETEDFVEQDMINETVYADEYEVLPFTLGDNSGVPVWLAKKLSRITKCDSVKFKRVPNGEQIEYKRITGSKLEKTADFDEKAGLANYKIDLQTTKNYLQ